MKLREIIVYIKSDLYRYTGDISISLFLRNYILNRSFCYSFWFRMTSAKNPILRIAARFNHARLTRKFGIQIPRGTKIGYGLYIGHGLSLTINQSTTIGNNCNISQFLTIGSNQGKAAVIGDNVYIGPSVCIVENVNIGSNSTIGAGSVVTKDIANDTTAAGIPAVKISDKNPGRFINRRWKI